MWWSITIAFSECCFDIESVSVQRLLNTESSCGVSNVALSWWSGLDGLAFPVVFALSLLLQTDSKLCSFPHCSHLWPYVGHPLRRRRADVCFQWPFSLNKSRVPFLLAYTRQNATIPWKLKGTIQSPFSHLQPTEWQVPFSDHSVAFSHHSVAFQ